MLARLVVVLLFFLPLVVSFWKRSRVPILSAFPRSAKILTHALLQVWTCVGTWGPSGEPDTIRVSLTLVLLSGQSSYLLPSAAPLNHWTPAAFIHSFYNKRPNLVIWNPLNLIAVALGWWLHHLMAGCRWDVWNILIIVISNQVVLHHTVHVQKGVYHGSLYGCLSCRWMHYIEWTCGCERLPSNSCCKWVKWEHREERTCKNGGMTLPNIRVWVSVSCAARHIEVAPSRLRTCMLQVWFCLNPPVSGKGNFPHRECERAPERWQTERLLRLSASLLSASFSSTSRHNQAVQPGLMNESKSFRWLQSETLRPHTWEKSYFTTS